MAPCAGVDVGSGRTEIRELLVSLQQVQQVREAWCAAVMFCVDAYIQTLAPSVSF